MKTIKDIITENIRAGLSRDKDSLNEASLITVVIEFDPRDDLSNENKDRMEGSILTTSETKTAKWSGKTLSYRSSQMPGDIISAWEDEGFNIDEFKSFSFKR